MNTWQSIGKTLGMLFIEMLCFLTVSTWKTKGMIAKNYQNHQKLWQKQWKLQQNKWKKAGDCISQQCSAVLSSVQSTTNFEVSWVFAGERAENEPNKYHKIHQKLRKNNEIWTKTMGTHTHTKQMEEGGELDFSATHSSTLSSTQQCSAVLNLQPISRFPDFFQGQGWKRWERSQNPFKQFGKNNEIWTKQWENTHTKQMEKGWELDFPAALSSTQQCSICNQFQGFLTFCRVRDEKGENEAKKKCKIHQKIGKTMISGQNNGKTHTKQIQKGWEFDFPAALSSTQQCSICNQFQGFLTFCRVRGEKAENEAKKKHKIHQKIGETMNSGQNKRKTQTKKGKKDGNWISQQHSAALSSAQSATNFKVSWLFAGSGLKRWERSQKKHKIHQTNWRNNELWTKQKKNTDKKREKGWELDFPAALSSQPISRFPDFLQGQGWKSWERSQKKAQNPSKQWENTQNKWKKAWNWISQQHSAAHSAALSSTQQCSICNQFQGFLTFSRVRDEKGENEAKKKSKIHSNNLEKQWNLDKTMGKHTQNKTMEKGWELDFPAALSSTQQCSICNQFQGFLTFCRVRGEKAENEAKKKRKIHQKIGKTMISGQNNGKTHTKQMEKGWELDFPAAFSSTQQHSAALSSAQSATNFKVSWLFAGSGVEKVRTKPKKSAKSIKNTQNKWKKAWNWISQQHSEAHSAALSSTQQCSICNQFQGFLTFCRVRVEKVRTKPKKSTKSIKQIGETMNSGQNKRKTQTKKREKDGNWISQQHSAALSSAQSATNFKVSWLFAGSGLKRWERSQKITQNQSKNLEKQCEKTHIKQMEKGMGLYFSPFLRFSHFLQGQGWKRWERSPKKSKIHQLNNDIWTKQWEKQWACYWNAVFFCRSKKNKLRMMAKRMMAKNDQNHQKLWQKPWKLQQNKWKKAGDCISQQCSAVLNLQLISKFPNFLQVRVKGVRTKPTNKTYGKTMKSGQSNEKKPAKQMEKGLGLYVSPISRFPDFLQGQGGKGENEAKKITQSPSTITEKTMKHVQSNGKQTRKNIWKKAGNCISQHCSAVLNLEPISRFPDFLQGHCERSENDKPHQRLCLNIYENLAKQLEKHGEWHWIAVLFAGLRWETLNPG